MAIVTPSQSDLVELDGLAEHIDMLKISLVGFTEGMKGCFINADASNLTQFKNLRNLISSDALLYFDIVVPLSRNLFTSICDTFDTIDIIADVDEFCANAEELIIETKVLVDKCSVCKEFHKAVYQCATVREIAGKKLCEKLQLGARYKDELSKQNKVSAENAFQQSANYTPNEWILLLPVCGWVFYGISYYNYSSWKKIAEEEMRKAAANSESSEVALVAVAQIYNIIIPALHCYLQNLEKVISILNAFSIALYSIKSDSTKLMEEKKALWFKKAKQNCKKVKAASISMLTYYDLCESSFRTLEHFKQCPSYIESWFRDEIGLASPISLISQFQSLWAAAPNDVVKEMKQINAKLGSKKEMRERKIKQLNE